MAIIGGTGFEEAAESGLRPVRQEAVQTRFGPARVSVVQVEGREVAFLSRHGPGHALAPHRINFLANVEALRLLGVHRVAATAAVGSLRPELPPGSLVLVDQFIDLTRRRAPTYFEEGDAAVHTDFTEPYCPEVRRALLEAGSAEGVELRPSGCYVGVDGPRYETPAEVRAYALLGGDVVGMTGLPEVVVAREAGLCYAAVAVVTNLAAGFSPRPISHHEVARSVEALRPRLVRVLTRALLSLPARRACRCWGSGRP